MLQPDAKGINRGLEAITSVTMNINNISVDVVSEIQKDLSQYDIISLVFLLYDVPDTALQRLTLLQRVSKDIDGRGLNLLYDWAVHAQARAFWKFEFLEALLVCQLYGVIRKLGFDVPSIRNHFIHGHESNYLNPMKKVLYKICEDINNENLMKLKKTLITYDIDTSDYESCELIFLELLSRKFIWFNMQNDLTMNGVNFCNTEKLASIIENLSGLAIVATKLRETENEINKKPQITKTVLNHSTPKVSQDPPRIAQELSNEDFEKFDGNFDDTFDLINEMNEKLSLESLKADASKCIPDDAYEIKDAKRIGVCYIINQDTFYPSKNSIENNFQHVKLEDREGSTRDKEILQMTMKSLNFHVETDDNLDHHEIMPQIINIIQNKFRGDDSVFVLCILSHGIEGHVYGADSVAVKVRDIEQLLDSDDAIKLRQKPKVLIIQACQVRQDMEPVKLIADSPKKSDNYFLPKSDFLIYWATAPEYEAYRLGKHGSVFINLLCRVIKDNAKSKHLSELCTKVTNDVANFCAYLKHAQMPIFQSTLRKNLYLRCTEA